MAKLPAARRCKGGDGALRALVPAAGQKASVLRLRDPLGLGAKGRLQKPRKAGLPALRRAAAQVGKMRLFHAAMRHRSISQLSSPGTMKVRTISSDTIASITLTSNRKPRRISAIEIL